MRGLSVALAFAALAAACGGDDDAAGTADASGDGAIGCLEDPRAEAYAANMEKDGAAGAFTFRLESSDPAPPVKGNNTWNLAILAGDAPVAGATVSVTPFMPDHGHGTSVVPQVTETDGDYTIDPLYLFMPGLWEVTVTADSGEVTDSAVFSFCIQG